MPSNRPKYLTYRSNLKFRFYLNILRPRVRKVAMHSPLFIPVELTKKADGTVTNKIWILKEGFKLDSWSRPMVVVLNKKGEHMIYYKSTGQNSGRRGDWLPAGDIEYRDGKPYAFKKFEGHPNFPPELELIGTRIAESVSQGKIKLNSWDLTELDKLYKALQKKAGEKQ